MKNEEKTLSNKLITTCQLPKDVLLGASLIPITGNCEIRIENFKNLITYQEDLILIQCKNHQLMLRGCHFIIEEYTKEELKISGKICELKFI